MVKGNFEAFNEGHINEFLNWISESEGTFKNLESKNEDEKTAIA